MWLFPQWTKGTFRFFWLNQLIIGFGPQSLFFIPIAFRYPILFFSFKGQLLYFPGYFIRSFPEEVAFWTMTKVWPIDLIRGMFFADKLSRWLPLASRESDLECPRTTMTAKATGSSLTIQQILDVRVILNVISSGSQKTPLFL